MQLGRRKGAAALAVAVVAGALGGAPGAFAAPGAPSGSGAPGVGSRDGTSEGTLPAVWPRPQSIRAGTASALVGDDVVLVIDRDGTTDPYAVEALRTVLLSAGARKITQVGEGEPVPGGSALVVRAGSDSSNSGSPAVAHGPSSALGDALRRLGAPARGDLPSGGYRLAVGRIAGRDTVALAGVGEDGLFHGVQTLRQLIDGRVIASAVVRDWPAAVVRGMAESFYGTPWTLEQRLGQLDFLGRTKQNRYLYAPGDDLYRQARWREPYPAGERAGFRALAERARHNHVTLAWAVAPGQAMCMSSAKDVQALNRKIDAMWALGVRAFQLQFQDISYSEWHCSADADTFGSGPRAAAEAQARVANTVARHLADRHPGAEALSLMPTEYYQDGTTEYRTELARRLDHSVDVAWTGVGVVPKTITGRDFAATREAFGHSLVTMDNYPVNDFAQDRIFLGPYTGREPAVAARSAALLANAMEQPTASRVPLFTAADFAWNPHDYRPRDSWRAAIDDVAGSDAATREAVAVLAGNEASSVLGADESAYLRPLIDAFWTAHTKAAGRTGKPDEADRLAAARLRKAFGVMRAAPQRLAGSALGDEVRPWTDQLARYGAAGQAAVDLLAAEQRGDGAAAWQAARTLQRLRGELKQRRVTVGKGVLDPFLDRAGKAFETWAGLNHEPSARQDAGVRTADFGRTRPLDTVTVLSDPGANGTVEAHVPGGGWRRLGVLADSGWTELAADGPVPKADAVRVVGTGVRHLVPWFTDGPKVAFSLARTETDAEIGGEEARVTARLVSRRPGNVHGRLVSQVPKGLTVRVPKASTVARGGEIDVAVGIKAAKGTTAGTYEIPLTFAGETRTVTVRVFPRTTGPDLALRARTDSSGDETPDFPASAAVDGDPTTRWSSPAEDDAWWQAELAGPLRLGQVVLRWQDAYAKSYRIQVSSDGRTWRTAATVADGHGGREAIRMDADDVRFIRVQGDQRGTRYGYSLWSVKAYAVAE